MKHSTVWLGGLGAVGTALLVAACGDDGGTGTGAGGAGGQGGGATASNTTSAVVATSGSGMASSKLGAECTSDADCGADLTCLRDSDDVAVFGGGPSRGYCSKACSVDEDCAGGVCLGDGADARCLESCTLGEPLLEFLDSELDPGKCHGREDVRCIELDAGQVCLPTCRNDDDCGGRLCDPRLAVCVDTVNTGLGPGEKCDPDAATPECAGVCVSFTDGQSLCSSWCALGGVELDAECGGLTAGLCVFSPSGHELGDSAFCTQACSKQGDCQNPDFWCFPVGGLTGNGVDNGFCFGADDCPNGQGDCSLGNDCVETAFGPKCLDPMFPIDTTGTGGAGMGGAGMGGAGMGGAGSSSVTTSASGTSVSSSASTSASGSSTSSGMP
jgi:hypothetical protein